MRSSVTNKKQMARMDGSKAMRDALATAPPAGGGPTIQDIADALAHQQAERQAVTKATGIQFEGDRIVHPAYVIGCPRPGCGYAASARSEGRAVRSLGTHLVLAHVKREQ